MLKKIATSILFIFLSGCASTYTPSAYESTVDSQIAFNFDGNAPLGFVEGSGADPSRYDLANFGLAKDAKLAMNIVNTKTKGRSEVFPDTVEQIEWYALLGNKGILQNQIPRTFFIQWYSPDGKLYHSDKFKASFWLEHFMKTSLKLSQPLDEKLIGRWRARVWRKDMLVDDRYFEIIKVTA